LTVKLFFHQPVHQMQPHSPWLVDINIVRQAQSIITDDDLYFCVFRFVDDDP